MTFSKGISRAVAMGIALLIGFGPVAPAAQAAYIVNLLQEGSDVVAAGSGSIDLTGLTFVVVVVSDPIISPSSGIRRIGVIRNLPIGSTARDLYNGVAGPTSFGSGLSKRSDRDSGDAVG